MYHVDLTDLIGKPFVDGGRGPDNYDCWGLCVEIFKRHGFKLKEYNLCCNDFVNFDIEYNAENPNWIKQSYPDVQVPSIVAIRFNPSYVSHVGVYIGDDKFMHTREKTGVVIERLAPWMRRIDGFYKQKEDREDYGK